MLTEYPLAAGPDYTREMRWPAAITASLLASSIAFAQAPAPKPATPAPAPKPATPAPAPKPAAQTPAPKPATPAPAVRRPAAPVARSGMAVTVTNTQGITLPGIRVEVLGASDRAGETNASGQLNLTAMQPGTYRVRFSGDRVVTFEKEVIVRAGQIADLDVSLNPAPPPPEPPPPAPAPPPPAPVQPAVGPAGQPRALSIVDMIEKELISGNQPRRDSLVSCSGNSRSTLVQLNQDQAERLYDTAEVTYYVIAGEGTAKMAGRDAALVAGSFVSVPRGTAHSLARRGRRPLIMLVTVSGTPCEEAR
jgi:mannose-6-phosphate isomerase-like protein (cupin superfamily)